MVIDSISIKKYRAMPVKTYHYHPSRILMSLDGGVFATPLSISVSTISSPARSG